MRDLFDRYNLGQSFPLFYLSQLASPNYSVNPSSIFEDRSLRSSFFPFIKVPPFLFLIIDYEGPR